MIASEYVARASPDGYTLLVGASGQMVYNPALGARLTYDPLKDFVPITMFASDPLVFVVNPSVQATNIKELIALAKAKPGALFYAAGAPPFFVAMETFKKVAGGNIVHGPSKGAGALSPSGLGPFHRAQLEKWTGVVKESDIRVAK